MVDLATSEITWQELAHRVKHGIELDDGRTVTEEMAANVINHGLTNILDRLGPQRFLDEGVPAGAQLYADSLKHRPHYVPDIASKLLLAQPK